MGFFSKKDEYGMVEEQIRILATNIEALNQKLIQDPNAVISPGEAEIEEKVTELMEMVTKLNKGVSDIEDHIRNVVGEQVEKIAQESAGLGKELAEFSKERHHLSINMNKFRETIEGLGKIDKEFVKELIERLDIFNKNVWQLNENLVSYHNKMITALNDQVNEIGNKVAFRLLKSSAFFIAGLILLAIVFSLVFNKLFG